MRPTIMSVFRLRNGVEPRGTERPTARKTPESETETTNGAMDFE
jgi:hypothetical protein